MFCKKPEVSINRPLQKEFATPTLEEYKTNLITPLQ